MTLPRQIKHVKTPARWVTPVTPVLPVVPALTAPAPSAPPAAPAPAANGPIDPTGLNVPGPSRRERLLAYLTGYVERHGVPPTIRDMRDAIDYPSTSMVTYDLNRLISDKKVRRVSAKQRTRNYMPCDLADDKDRLMKAERTLSELRTAIRQTRFSGLTPVQVMTLKGELIAKIDSVLKDEVRA